MTPQLPPAGQPGPPDTNAEGEPGGRAQRHIAGLILALTAGMVVVVVLAAFLAMRLAGPGPDVVTVLTTSAPPTSTAPSSPRTSATSSTSAPGRASTFPLPAELSLTCTLAPVPARRGQQVTLTYVIDSPIRQRVGLGAGVRHGNTDFANGDGDEDSVVLRPGRQSISRSLSIPDDAPTGRYEINGEIWPENKVGADGAETLADQVCGDTVTIR